MKGHVPVHLATGQLLLIKKKIENCEALLLTAALQCDLHRFPSLLLWRRKEKEKSSTVTLWPVFFLLLLLTPKTGCQVDVLCIFSFPFAGRGDRLVWVSLWGGDGWTDGGAHKKKRKPPAKLLRRRLFEYSSPYLTRAVHTLHLDVVLCSCAGPLLISPRASPLHRPAAASSIFQKLIVCVRERECVCRMVIVCD